MDRTERNIAVVAAKLVATIAATVAAVTIAVFVGHISNAVNNMVIGNDSIFGVHPSSILFRPRLLNEPRVDVIFALLIPISMALWWRQSSKRIVACCLGISTGFVPVVAQVISWPFIYHSPGDVSAVAAVAMFATAAISIGVTRRFLQAGSHDASANPTVPHHIRRGLLTLYVILVVPWTIWFGYVAYNAHATINFDLSQSENVSSLLDQLNDPTELANRETAASELARFRSVWKARTNDEINERIWEALQLNGGRLTIAIYAALAGIVPIILYPIGVMIVWLCSWFVNTLREIVPPHVCKGLVRLYVAVSIPWAAWFGYTAYEARSHAKQLHSRQGSSPRRSLDSSGFPKLMFERHWQAMARKPNN
jgi:hypothetical protein